MRKFRFIHTADLHLDSPFRGLTETSKTLGDRLHSATFDALVRIVNHAIESKSDFVIFAGDLYDSRDRSLRALVQFRNQMERLQEFDIAAFVVHGNHDPLDGWGSEFKMPQNVHTFDGSITAVPVIRNGKKVASVAGVSYTSEQVTENLARSFKPSEAEDYSIAVLHANIGSQSGHADYAPASISDLTDSGFDYWALGHIHKQAVLSTSPHIVYPGNPQGRHIRETGPRGCVQVDVDATGRTKIKFLETDVIRWSTLDFSITHYSRMDSMIDDLKKQAKQLVSDFDGPTVLRCRLTGIGSLHADLGRDGMAEQIRHQIQSITDVESVQIATQHDTEKNSLALSEPIIKDFLSLVDQARIDPSFRDNLSESLSPLFRKRELSAPGADQITDWIEQAGALGVDLLLKR